MIRLPVSGIDVEIRTPTGAEELFLLDSDGTDMTTALGLLERLARPTAGGHPTWERFTITDVETLLLELRRKVLGDRIRTDVHCPAEGCGAHVDVEFSIAEFLEGHRPAQAKHVTPDAVHGWFRLNGGELRFRLPSAVDQVAALRWPDPEGELVERTMAPQPVPVRQRRRIEAVMEAMAPTCSGALAGSCPQCGREFEMEFAVPNFVLTELRNHASFLYDEIHLLARNYHWTEEAILTLPSHRRMQYVERLTGVGEPV